MEEPRQLSQAQPQTCQSIEWYAEGDLRTIEFGDFKIIVRYVGRKGRRARIAITTPVGAAFRSLDPTEHALLNSATTGIIGDESSAGKPVNAHSAGTP